MEIMRTRQERSVESFLDILAWVLLFPCLLFAFLGAAGHAKYLLHPFAYQLDRARGAVPAFYWPRWVLVSVVAISWLVSRQL
jgi:hypothetical protein